MSCWTALFVWLLGLALGAEPTPGAWCPRLPGPQEPCRVARLTRPRRMAVARWLPRLALELKSADDWTRRYSSAGGMDWSAQQGLRLGLRLTFPWGSGGRAGEAELAAWRREREQSGRTWQRQAATLRRARARLCGGAATRAARAELAAIDSLLALNLLARPKCGLVSRFGAAE